MNKSQSIIEQEKKPESGKKKKSKRFNNSKSI